MNDHTLASQLKPGDLVRHVDPSSINTIYRVIKIVEANPGWGSHTLTLRPVFGIFKQDYKTKKTRSASNGVFYQLVKIDIIALGVARQAFDEFINQEIQRLSVDDA